MDRSGMILGVTFQAQLCPDETWGLILMRSNIFLAQLQLSLKRQLLGNHDERSRCSRLLCTDLCE